MRRMCFERPAGSPSERRGEPETGTWWRTLEVLSPREVVERTTGMTSVNGWGVEREMLLSLGNATVFCGKRCGASAGNKGSIGCVA